MNKKENTEGFLARKRRTMAFTNSRKIPGAYIHFSQKQAAHREAISECTTNNTSLKQGLTMLHCTRFAKKKVH